MDSNRIVRIVAGSFIIISLCLGVEVSWNPLFVSSKFLFFTAFVGLNLFQSGFTNFCPLDRILWKLGVKKPGEAEQTPSGSPPTVASV